MKLAGWAADLVDLLLPPGCVACGAWIPGGGTHLVCAACRSRFRAAPWPRCPRCHLPRGTGRPSAPDCRECRGWDPSLGFARYAYLMSSPVDRLVYALKYEGWPELADEMGRTMAALRLADAPGPPTLITPVPTTRRRLRERGYNQAELLAGSVAACRGIPLRRVLTRVREGPTQVSLTPSRRRENVAGAFEAVRASSESLRGAHVLLVDDVLTTGATAGAAASALVRAGARAVTLMTFARALPFAGV